jgi:hypothetical protein
VIGVCGDNCAMCPRNAATRSGSPEELEKVKELWVRLELRAPDFPADGLACRGCSPENDCAYPRLRACARERSLPNCGQCDDYPCSSIDMVCAASERLRERATDVCTSAELAVLNQAFFSKRRLLNGVHARRAGDALDAQQRSL